MQTPEHDAAEAVREMLRHLLKHLDTLGDQLKATTGSDPGAIYPWAVAASRRVMEGFHAFGIEDELRHGRFMTPDITTRTATALKRVMQIADEALEQRREAAAGDQQAKARVAEDRNVLEALQFDIGIGPYTDPPSLIPRPEPEPRDYTPRPEMVVAVDAVMATAWQPPAEADEESVLKAEQEVRHFMAEFVRLGELVETEGDQNELERIADHRDRLFTFIQNAPVTSARTAAAVLRILFDEQIGLGSHALDERDFAAFARLMAWVEATAEQQRQAEEDRARLDEIKERLQEGKRGRPEVVSAVDAVLAAGWREPEKHTDDDLVAAEQEIARLWEERRRLCDALEQQGDMTGEDEDEVMSRLWDRADELSDWVRQSHVTGPKGAAAMLRVLLRQLPNELGDNEDKENINRAALEQVLAVFQRQGERAGREGRH